MNLKKIKIISTILVILLSFLFHSIYDKFPNILTSFLFPVNESIFEHMKIIFLSYIVSFIFEMIIMKLYNINNNLKTSVVFNIVFNIVFFNIIFIPIYLIFSHNTVITISIYIFTIIITEFLSYKLLQNKKEFKFINKYYYIILIIIFMLFIYFTYYPIKNMLFIDEYNKKIGINNYY